MIPFREAYVFKVVIYNTESENAEIQYYVAMKIEMALKLAMQCNKIYGLISEDNTFIKSIKEIDSCFISEDA